MKSLSNAHMRRRNDKFSAKNQNLDKLVMCTLKHTKNNELIEESFLKALLEMSISKELGFVLFPNPALDVVKRWWEILDNDTKSFALTLDKNLKIRTKISLLVKQRIQKMQPYKNCVRQVYNHTLNPSMLNASASNLVALMHTSSVIWTAINDKSPPSDYNYYTKRIILKVVLFTSISHWLATDRSNIDEYIDARIDDALKLAKLKGKLNIDNLKKHLPLTNHPLKMRD